MGGSGFEKDGSANAFDISDEKTAIEATPPNHTVELETSELKEMSQDGVAVEKPNLTVGLLSTDIVEIKPGAAVELDAKVEIGTELIPRAPIVPVVVASTKPPRVGEAPTEIVGRIPTPAEVKRSRVIVIGIYFLATLALGLAILSRL